MALQAAISQNEREDVEQEQKKLALNLKGHEHSDYAILRHTHVESDILDLQRYTFENLKQQHPLLESPFLHKPMRHGNEAHNPDFALLNHTHQLNDLEGLISPQKILFKGLNADTLDGKHAQQILDEAKKLIPAKKVIERWMGGGGGVRLSDTAPSDIAASADAGSGEKAARYDHIHKHPVFASGDLHTDLLPIDGKRAMTGNLDLAANELLTTNLRFRERTSAVMEITKRAAGDMRDLYLRNLRVYGQNLQLANYYAANYVTCVGTSGRYVIFRWGATECARLAETEFNIARAGDITFLDNKTIGLVSTLNLLKSGVGTADIVGGDGDINLGTEAQPFNSICAYDVKIPEDGGFWFDAADWLNYDRANNRFLFKINNVTVAYVDAAGFHNGAP